jgi:hypothetical protein
VIVVAIEEKDAGVGAVERARARQAPEASADHHDTMRFSHGTTVAGVLERGDGLPEGSSSTRGVYPSAMTSFSDT